MRPLRRLRKLGEISPQGFGECLHPAPGRFLHGIAHRQLKPPMHARIGLDTQLSHRLDRPDPDVIFLFAAALVSFKAHRVMADFMEKDSEADAGLGVRTFDPIRLSAVGMPDAPGAAAHGPPPALDSHLMTAGHLFDDPGERSLGKRH